MNKSLQIIKDHEENIVFHTLKAISGLRQFLAAEPPLKVMKKAFYFTSKALFVLKILNFLFRLFGYAAKHLHKKDKVISNLFTMSQPG